MAKTLSYLLHQITGGGSASIDCTVATEIVTVYSSGSITLGSAYTVTHSGTPDFNTKIRVGYKGNTSLVTDTGTGKHISILGYVLSNNQAKIDLIIDFYWNGSSWDAFVIQDFNATKTAFIETSMIVGSAITTAKINAKAITAEKLEDLAEGNILVGNASSRPVALDLSDNAKIPIGNGTTVVPRTISGDITIDNTGVVTIGDGKVTEDMLAFTMGELVLEEFEISTEQILTLNSSPVTVVPAQGANTLLIPVEFWMFLDYESATYASGGAVHLRIGTVSVGNVAATTVTSASDLVTKMILSTAVASGSLLNQALVVDCATADFTTGDSPLKCKLLYRKVTF